MTVAIIWGIVMGQVVGFALVVWAQRGTTTYRGLTYSEGLKITEQCLGDRP